MNEVEFARHRIAENNARQDLKERGAYLFARRQAAGTAITNSADPTTGLQPAIGSHDAWPYRPGPVVKPAGIVHPYGSNAGTDLASIRQAADNQPPRCTSCGSRLDPQWCHNISADDRERGYF